MSVPIWERPCEQCGKVHPMYYVHGQGRVDTCGWPSGEEAGMGDEWDEKASPLSNCECVREHGPCECEQAIAAALREAFRQGLERAAQEAEDTRSMYGVPREGNARFWHSQACISAAARIRALATKES